MLNEVTLMGRLTRDPELKHRENNIAFIRFSIAVERDYKGKDTDKITDFIDIVAWRNTAEFIGKYFAKGKMIIVKGSLQINSWTDNSGNRRKSAEVIAEKVYFGENKKNDDLSNTNNTKNNNFVDELNELDEVDDLPFE